jgi:hypothetical protein
MTTPLVGVWASPAPLGIRATGPTARDRLSIAVRPLLAASAARTSG